MKRFFGFVAALIFCTNFSFGQVSVNAGATYTKWKHDHTEFRPGFSLGASYLLQNDSIPFFGQIGLDFAQKGVNLVHLHELNWGVNTYSLHLPVSVGYKFPINNHISVNPKVGLYADFGLWGRVSDHDSHEAAVGYEDVAKASCVDGFNPYSDLKNQTTNNKNFSRFDAGYSLGVNVFLYRTIYLDLGLCMGLIDQFDSGLVYYENSKPMSFSLTLGYLFLSKASKNDQVIEE